MLKDGKLCVKLIHCGNINIANPEDQVQKNIFFMPMGLFPLAGVLKQHDFDVEIIHTDLEYNKEIKEILDFSLIDVVGFDCHWINQGLVVLEVAQLIKKINPNIFIFLGGFSASLFAEEIISSCMQIDAVIRGDGEIPILELCKTIYDQKSLLSDGDSDTSYMLDNVQNLVWKKDGKTFLNPFSYVGTQEEMDKLDFAAVDLLRNWEDYRNLSRYYSSIGSINSEPMFLLEVGRGCEYACTFCGGNCVAQKRMNNRKQIAVCSTDSVVKTLKKVKSLGFQTIYTCFEFEGSDTWFIKFLEGIKENGISINYGYGCWRIPSPSLINALAECCKKVVIEISPETGNMNLRKLNKDMRLYYSNQELEECLDYISTKDNMKVQLFFGYYLVNDNEDTILETIGYILKLLIKYVGLIEIEYTNFSTDPGSLIFLYPEKYDIDINVHNFNDYIRNLKENYVEIKKQSPDLTLFRPNNISSKKAEEIDRKVRLLNYIFYTYRNSVSIILQKTKVADVIMEILQDNRLCISQEKKFIPEDVRDIMIMICNSKDIVDSYLLKTINTEYLNQKSSHKISKPTTQLYLLPQESELISEESLKNVSCTEEVAISHEEIGAIDFDFL